MIQLALAAILTFGLVAPDSFSSRLVEHAACAVPNGAPATLTQVRKVLGSLDQRNPSCISAALGALTPFLRSHSGTLLADSAFVDFRAFYYSVLKAYEPPVTALTGFPASLDSLFNTNGIHPVESLYGFRVSENIGFLRSHFAHDLSEGMRSFLEHVDRDRGTAFCDDAVLLVSFDELADRIMNWYGLVERHVAFPLRDEARANASMYLKVFVHGFDNTPLFTDSLRQGGQGSVRPDVRRAYERFLSLSPPSGAKRAVQEFYDLLSAQQFRWSPNVDSYVQNLKLPEFGC